MADDLGRQRTPDSAHRPGGLRSQVKPTFLLPVVGTSLFGALLSPHLDLAAGLLHVLATATAIYLAHLVDEYVDAHVRGEEPVSVPIARLRAAIMMTGLVALSVIGGLWATGHPTAAIVTLPLPVLAVLHAPVLDRHPVTGTLDYPLGIALVLVGGFLAQAGTVPPSVLGLAAVFVPVLAGAKITIDRLDSDFDRTVGKRTVPVLLGERDAARASAGCLAVAVGLLGLVVLVTSLSAWALFAAPFLLGAGWAGLDPDAGQAFRRQMVLAYPFAIVAFLAACATTGCRVVGYAELLFAVTERVQL